MSVVRFVVLTLWDSFPGEIQGDQHVLAGCWCPPSLPSFWLEYTALSVQLNTSLVWGYGLSESGYTDTGISLYRIKQVFDPLTKARAAGRPRVLINDEFGTHESLESMEFCFVNNIIFCRFFSYIFYKFQPCNVGPFGPVKIAYREEVEQLYRGGSNIIGQQHFTLLYDRARRKAMTTRNILSGWSKTGLRPLNPERVLKGIQKPPVVDSSPSTIISKTDLLNQEIGNEN